MKNLQLSLKKKWFDLTKSGIKTEDYREINSYWNRRLYNCIIGCTKSKYYGDCQEIIDKDKKIEVIATHPCYKCEYAEKKEFDINIMTLGYPKSTDKDRIIKFKNNGITVGEGNPEWGAEPGKKYFIIKHGEMLE